MARLIGRIPRRQVLPGRARAQHPQHPVQDGSRVAPRAASPIRPSLFLKERLENRPLLIGEIHAVRYDDTTLPVYEIASSC